MRTQILLGAAAVLVAAGGGVAWAQMPPGPAPMGGPDGAEGMRPRMEMMRRFEHMHERGMEREASGAASFSLHKGDMDIRVRCSENEPTFVCVRAVAMLLDKVGGTNTADTGTTGPAPATPTTTPPSTPAAPSR